MVTKLDPAARDRALADLPGWTFDADAQAIRRRFRFADFAAAFAFMTKVAAEAERADHHPDWSNLYDRVDILLTTHDADGVSARDIAMAHAIDALAG